MKFKILEKSKDKISFLLEDTSSAYSNTLRRVMLINVPTMAIEDVEFRKNSSALYDEIIAHRLGLVTLTTDLKSYNLISECKCKGEGCARCSLKLTLKANGPKTVYASDIKSTDPKVKPVYPKTIIVKLLKDQELELEATAILGTGKEHSKWAPGHIFYKLKPEINIDNKKLNNPEAVLVSCPVDVFEMKNKKLSVNEKNLTKCHLCEACTDVSDAITLANNEQNYIFYLESWGQLSPKKIILTAIDIFNTRLSEFEKSI
ncbi:DNA-directed RNA polymerase subunit D [Candidatus Woesearchaeota archaeon]|nr:DNA-directed RNA polymerase subunit D [Candidatus Woesearchaeota archaeon]